MKMDKIIEGIAVIFLQSTHDYIKHMSKTKVLASAEVLEASTKNACVKMLEYLKIDIAEDCEVKEGDMLTNLGFTAHRVNTIKDGFAVHETHEGQKFTELKYAKLIHRPERNIISANIVGVKGE